MASRPAWCVRNGHVIKQMYGFSWNGGFAYIQTQKNVKALHEAIATCHGEHALEVSSKSNSELGRKLGAFSLRLGEYPLENIFQAAKKYEFGGPYEELLLVTPREAKTDERHRTSGNLRCFVYEKFEWPLEPKTAFYDYIYVKAVIENLGYEVNLDEYQWFTDIVFNPNKSINCQARAIALYKLLQSEKQFDVLNNKKKWMNFHLEHVCE